MTEENEISATECARVRQTYNHNEGLEALSDEVGLEVNTIRYHLYGDCTHDIDVEPVVPPVEHRISEEECNRYRRRIHGGESPHDLSDEIDTRWRSLARHLAGECDHDSEVEPLDIGELYQHKSVSAETCVEFRRQYHEGDLDALSIADRSEFNYQTVLRHLKGRCSHEVELEPKPVLKRSENIDRETCRTLRERWRSDPDLTFEALATEFNCSAQTAEQHIKFHCQHRYEETLADEMPIFEDLLSPPEEPAGFDREAVLENAVADDIDTEEAALDIVSPDHGRTTTSRVVRNSESVLDLKEAYDYRCQLCGNRRFRDDNRPYAEGHHVRPLSPPYDGPDVPGNVLILCSNHHADFDYGVVEIDPETLVIRHAFDETVDGETVTVLDSHSLETEHLEYHANELSEVGE